MSIAVLDGMWIQGFRARKKLSSSWLKGITIYYINYNFIIKNKKYSISIFIKSFYAETKSRNKLFQA